MTGKVTAELEKELHLREPAGDWNVQIGPEEQIKFRELFEYKKKYEKLREKAKNFVDIVSATSLDNLIIQPEWREARDKALKELKKEI